MRSSCETVLTKSDLTCSTSRSLEMSRKAKMRPATAPSRIAHHRLGDRQPDLLAPAHDRNEPFAAYRFVGRLEAPLQHVDRRASERDRGRDAGDHLGGAVPEDDLAVAVDGDDPLGDVGEDRDRPLPLERDALVQLRVRERRRRAGGHGEQRLDLLLPPLARHGGVDGEHARGSLPRHRRPARRGRRRGRPGASGRGCAGARRRPLARGRPAPPTGGRRRRASLRPGSGSRALPPHPLRRPP